MRAGFLILALLAGLAAGSGALAGRAEAGPAIVVDVSNGRVLGYEEPFRRWYPASLTKLMTVYVAFRAVAAGEITMQSPVRFSQNAAKEPPSKMGYRPGSVITVDNAIKMLMVKSANDVATALAESVGGSESAFVARMNREAARLGMNGTRFANAHGLHSDAQYSTARDLALLGIAIRREFPQYAGYFSMEAIASGNEIMPNNNTLIARFSGADGMKTGYTCASGFNLIATATRNGRTLLAVVIGEHSVESRAEKAADLLARGFSASGFGATRIDRMQPVGERQTQGTNMRPVICTDAARQVRMSNRDEQGRPVVRSPHIVELNRPRRAVTVGLGGASGPTGAAAPGLARRAPVPTPRPDYTPPVQRAGGG